MDSRRSFFLECYKLGIIKFGKFILKSGIESPFYVDLRPLASDPKILSSLADQLLNILPENSYDLICGVPYAALPMATAMSLKSGIPLIIKRKEAKSYGTKKLIEGIFEAGQSCLLVEDVITSGKSLLETIPEIENEGLRVKDIVIVLDREQGGKQILEQRGYRVRNLFTISEVCAWLYEEKMLGEQEITNITNFLSGNKIEFEEKKRLSYEDKITKVEHPAAKKLLEIAIRKKSNLIASADVTTTKELLDFAETVGSQIAALKTHIDIITDFSFEKTILPLKEISSRLGFLLMEDRKFADIGSTQEMQYTQGMYRISEWADLITSQVIGGKKSLDYFHNSGIVAILSMSSEGALTDSAYFEAAQKVAVNHHGVIGGVSQKPISEALLLFTPGVNMHQTGDGKGQQYNTPEFVFQKLHTDFIIVGRGIYRSEDPARQAEIYKKAGWEAYLKAR